MVVKRIAALLVLVFTAAAPAIAADVTGTAGTWRGSAEEFASPHIQGRTQITVDVMPDGRFTSVWRQAGRERRTTGHWRLSGDLIVFEADSVEFLPPRLSLVHQGNVAYGTALAPLPEGRSATLMIALTHVARAPLASRPRP
jgi:hypothetical protein